MGDVTQWTEGGRMSEQEGAPVQGRPDVVTNPADLAAATRPFAASVFDTVSREYLHYRRVFHHDPSPSLDTPPPESSEAQQTEGARLAQGALRIMPREAHAVPLIRDLVDHLQWVVDIHTLTQHERTQLHNLTMVFLHGVTDGVQAWYVEWLHAAAVKLADVTHPKYYLAYPWQALLYRSPSHLAALTEAISSGSVSGIEREVQHMAEQLVAVLRDPLGTQPKLAFMGRDGERRKVLFDLKTAAGLALGAYLAAETVRALTNLGQPQSDLPRSVVDLPSAMVPQLMTDAAS
jgi:hypothetical protein